MTSPARSNNDNLTWVSEVRLKFKGSDRIGRIGCREYTQQRSHSLYVLQNFLGWNYFSKCHLNWAYFWEKTMYFYTLPTDRSKLNFTLDSQHVKSIIKRRMISKSIVQHRGWVYNVTIKCYRVHITEFKSSFCKIQWHLGFQEVERSMLKNNGNFRGWGFIDQGLLGMEIPGGWGGGGEDQKTLSRGNGYFLALHNVHSNKPVCPSCFLRIRAALLSRKPNNKPQLRENRQTPTPGKKKN